MSSAFYQLQGIASQPLSRFDRLLEAERAGTRACRSGAKKTDCPWNPLRPEAKAWQVGHEIALQPNGVFREIVAAKGMYRKPDVS